MKNKLLTRHVLINAYGFSSKIFVKSITYGNYRCRLIIAGLITTSILATTMALLGCHNPITPEPEPTVKTRFQIRSEVEKFTTDCVNNEPHSPCTQQSDIRERIDHIARFINQEEYNQYEIAVSSNADPPILPPGQTPLAPLIRVSLNEIESPLNPLTTHARYCIGTGRNGNEIIDVEQFRIGKLELDSHFNSGPKISFRTGGNCPNVWEPTDQDIYDIPF
jgi:hypothetical protein